MKDEEKAKDMKILARFPDEDPNPVLWVARDGKILYANKSSQGVLHGLGCKVGEPCPDSIKRFIEKDISGALDKKMEVEGRIFSFFIIPMRDADYIYLYGQDVTERNRAEEKLQQGIDIQKVLDRILMLSLEDISLEEVLNRTITYWFHLFREAVPVEDPALRGEEGAVPGAVVAIHSFGDFLGWHPHLHVLCTDGCFCGNGATPGFARRLVKFDISGNVRKPPLMKSMGVRPTQLTENCKN